MYRGTLLVPIIVTSEKKEKHTWHLPLNDK